MELPRHASRSMLIDLVKIASPEEEEAYRRADEFYAAARSHFSPVDFYGVDLSSCLQHLPPIGAEYLLCVARAVDMVIGQGFDHVVVWFEAFPDYYWAILDEAAAVGHCDDPERAVYRIADGKLIMHPRHLVGDLRKHLQTHVAVFQDKGRELADIAPRHEPLETGGVVVLAATAANLYLAYMAEAIRVLGSAGIPFRVYAASRDIRDKIRELAAGEELSDNSLIVMPRMAETSRSRDPERLLQAMTDILEQVANRALEPVPAGPIGTHTLDYAWGNVKAPRALGHIYGFLIEIERLSALLAHDKPACLYHFPHLTFFDPALPQLTRAHGGISASSIFLSIKADHRSLQYPSSDAITVLGALQTDMLVSRGYPRERIFELGAPLLDTEFSRWTRETARAHLERSLQTRLSEAVILVATGGVKRADEFVWLPWLAEALPRDGSVSVVIKLHQSNNAIPYRKVIDKLGQPDITLTQQGEIYPYLAAADVVISDNSHVGKLTVYAGRKLWVANISEGAYAFDRYDEQGVARLAATRADFADIVAEAKGDKRFERRDEVAQEFLRREFTSNDGLSRKRMGEFFRACIEGRIGRVPEDSSAV
jgi:hypothetical protein